MGTLYRRGQVWWVKYYVNGRPVRESTGVDGDGDMPPTEARRFLKGREGRVANGEPMLPRHRPPRGARRSLKGREGRVANGEPMLPRADRVRYQEAAADLRQHYATTG